MTRHTFTASVLLLLAGLIAACTDTAEPPTETTSPATSTTSSLPGRVLSSSQKSREVDATFQSGQFLITLGEVVHDAETERLYLGLRFQNLGDSWAAPGAEGTLRIGEADHHIFLGPATAVPPATSIDVTGEVRIADPDSISGVLVWGRSDETSTTIELASGTADGFGRPRPLRLDAWGQIGRFSVHFTGGTLLADALRSPRAPAGHHVIRLEFDEYTSTASPVNGFHPTEHLLLQWPDGTVVEPLSGTPGRAPMSWTASTGNNVEFAVPTEFTGHYQVLLASVGKHSLSNLHPDLVERVPIEFEISDETLGAPTFVPGMPLPQPRLPSDLAVANSFDEAVSTPEVNISGFAFRATRLTWDQDESIAILEGEARLLPPIQTARTDAIFSTPVHFAPRIALESNGRLYSGIGAVPPVMTLGTPQAVSYEFRFVDELDPRSANLFLGRDHMTPSILPLGPDSSYRLDPEVPEIRVISGPVVTVGNYVVEPVAYRFGLPRELDRPPAGMKALEVVVEVTAREVESPGAFGLGFDTRTQLFLTHRDGYLLQSANHEHVDLEDGGKARLGATFYVPAGWRPGTIVLTVRSVNEITAVTRLDWVEATFSADFEETPLAEPQEAQDAPVKT